MSIKLPKVIGHRGCAGYAPENTIEGIHTAADMGVEWVELDVKLTKDHVPILFHDETLERTTNGHGAIKDLTLKELKDLEAGSWFADSFTGITVPTLEEALDAIIERGLGFNMEIKPCPGREIETAEASLDLLTSMWDELDKILISSFQHTSLETALDFAEDFPRALLLPEEWPENWAELAEYLKVDCVNVNGNEVTREQVESLIDLEKQILAYTINDPDRCRILQGYGVDGFFSDTPDVILENILTVH